MRRTRRARAWGALACYGSGDSTMFANILASLLSALASFAPTIAAALGHEPVPPVGKPRKPGFDAIEAGEDAAAATKRTGPRA